ncbi:MAG: Ig-like domain-containing protein [Bacteroidales bacterium]|nr:Ig-like domain-containing protein [Bacteroidales bacterium]
MKKARISIIILTLTLLLTQCAKMVTPVGGPKDITPPEVAKTQPANSALNFNGHSFKLTFNEFVVLNNATENCIFSPPLKYTPEFTLSNKSLTVKILDTLKPNTTYNVVFADCIKDFTEGNLLPIYQYTFSTGAQIDSCSISGFLFNAQEPEPVKNCLVFLYHDNIDSLPYTTRPDYITKTLTDGSFSFNNIAEGEYKIFALNDINKNLVFDLPNEEIAFGIEPIKAKAIIKVDTTQKDSSSTINSKKRNKFNWASNKKATDSLQNVLWLYTEKDTIQQLLKSENSAKGIYQLSFRKELSDFSITFDKELPYFEVLSKTKDTVTFYFKELPKDTLHGIVKADNNIDTVEFAPFQNKAGRGSRGRRAANTEEKFTVNSSHSGELYKPFTIHFSYPIKPATDIPVRIVKKKNSGNDTTWVPITVPDTFVTQLEINFDKEEKVPYNIFIKDSVFYGYNMLTNDSLNFNFTIHSEKEYGDLTMNYLIQNEGSYIIQLLKKDNLSVVQQNILTHSDKTIYQHLTPGDYRIRVIEDKNGNGIWDTGDYHNKTQPERIFYFDKDINIRGYWEVEETFQF